MNAGATYNRSTFIFPNDAKPYIDRLMGGESVNIKKEFQFFGTPDKLADRLIMLAQINDHNAILEPSAGQGAILAAIKRACFSLALVDYYELMSENIAILEKNFSPASLKGGDFLRESVGQTKRYDRIIANPPFSKNQDIDHIYTMWDCLAQGGRIVTIASKHWQFSTNKKETEFREFLEENNAEIIEVNAGEFKESGTNIATVIIVLNKR